jgi:PTS system glucose-specific IIA component
MLKNLFKKSKDEEKLYAPMNGEVVKLEDVPDPVFSEKMMGEGVAIQPSVGEVVSPVDGKVVQVPDTKHAIGLETEKGTEILIHVGLETVSLKGEGFTVNVNTGDEVRVGQSLMTFDMEYIQKHADSTVSPMVITNSKDLDKDISVQEVTEAKAGETEVISIS